MLFRLSHFQLLFGFQGTERKRSLNASAFLHLQIPQRGVKMGKKAYILLAAIVLLLVVNGLIGISKQTAADVELTDDKEIYESAPYTFAASASSAPTSQTDATQNIASADRTYGWQMAEAINDSVLYNDEFLTQPMNASVSGGDRVIICQKSAGACRVRYGTILGWLAESALTPQGEPVIYDDNEEAGTPASLSGSEIAKKLDAIAKKHDCIGVQLAVITDGKVSHTYEYGYGHRGNKTPMSSDTKLRAASVSKLIVGMGIMSMHDMGTIDIDTDISNYWTSEIVNPSHKGNPITFRHIMTHTSSMEDFGYKKRATSALQSNLNQYTSYMTVPPGSMEAYDYNNSAICAAGAIAGNAAGCNFDRYVREYFFAPMGIDASFHAKNIRQTSLISPTYNEGTTTMTVDDLLNITYNGGPADDYTLYAGGMIISAKDLARMVCILMNGGSYENMYYLSQESVKQMLTPYFKVEDYQQCLILRYGENMYNGENLYYHNGNLMGVYSLLCFNPDTGNGLVLITNGANEPRLKNRVYTVCGDFAEAAADLWID